jgi:3-isopropylmalate dehydrogenase
MKYLFVFLGLMLGATLTSFAQADNPNKSGQDIANPFSLILSAAMLLGWYGQRKNLANFIEAGSAIENAVAQAMLAHESTVDVGGKLGTRASGQALVARLAD